MADWINMQSHATVTEDNMKLVKTTTRNLKDANIILNMINAKIVDNKVFYCINESIVRRGADVLDAIHLLRTVSGDICSDTVFGALCRAMFHNKWKLSKVIVKHSLFGENVIFKFCKKGEVQHIRHDNELYRTFMYGNSICVPTETTTSYIDNINISAHKNKVADMINDLIEEGKKCETILSSYFEEAVIMASLNWNNMPSATLNITGLKHEYVFKDGIARGYVDRDNPTVVNITDPTHSKRLLENKEDYLFVFLHELRHVWQMANTPGVFDDEHLIEYNDRESEKDANEAAKIILNTFKGVN